MELWQDLKKNKPLLITVLAAIGVFLYIIYKNGAGNQTTSAPTNLGTYVEGVIPIPGSPGPQGPPGSPGPPIVPTPGGPKPPKRPPRQDGNLRVYGHAGTLESSPHVPIFKNGHIVKVPVGSLVQWDGRTEKSVAGKGYFWVTWNDMQGWLGADVLETLKGKHE